MSKPDCDVITQLRAVDDVMGRNAEGYYLRTPKWHFMWHTGDDRMERSGGGRRSDRVHAQPRGGRSGRLRAVGIRFAARIRLRCEPQPGLSIAFALHGEEVIGEEQGVPLAIAQRRYLDVHDTKTVVEIAA